MIHQIRKFFTGHPFRY